MQGFKILGQPYTRCDLNYRGTYRCAPTYVGTEPDESEVNTLFRWYCDDEYEVGVLLDLEKSNRYLSVYREITGDNSFELVAVTNDAVDHSAEGLFLGYDISMGFGYSLLSWGLVDINKESLMGEPIEPLVRLIKSHFRPLLNEYVLFGDRITAEFCLECLAATNFFLPDLWESGKWKFEVVEISVIDK